MIDGEMRRREASAYLRTTWGLSCAPSTLATMARDGTGPIYRLRGKYAFYTQQSLDEWARPRIGGLKRRASGGRSEAHVG